MHSDCTLVDAHAAPNFVGQLVLLELVCQEELEPVWCLFHIVGFVLPVEGVYPHGYFMAIPATGDRAFPEEVFFSDIRTIRVMRYRDRQGSGNVLGRITHPTRNRSGAALPAHRDGAAVAMNGSTGEAHP